MRIDHCSLARQTPSIDRRIRKGVSVTKLDGWKGQMLYGKTLGVIGECITSVSMLRENS